MAGNNFELGNSTIFSTSNRFEAKVTIHFFPLKHYLLYQGFWMDFNALYTLWTTFH